MKKSKRYVESAKLVDSNKDYEIKETYQCNADWCMCMFYGSMRI